ncbi:hypothetical protein GJ744_009513 [Endocarpon pusillum]|uniref:PiggyBac transposable element-derived protein domain-containing protein n=1 Tax=Endocarpon pusillum TaxID=364733 RepID=A0A8H7AJF8_9EURO|nr:hypothetical protein GJ744_009513 [Endocarpon pusillum]
MVQKHHQEEISGPLDTIEAAPLAKDLPYPKRARIESRKALENRAQTVELEVPSRSVTPQLVHPKSSGEGNHTPSPVQNQPLFNQKSSFNRLKKLLKREKKAEWQTKIESTRNKAEKLKILSEIIGPVRSFPERLKSNYDPLSLFHRFIPSELFEEIAEHTNQYARQERAKETKERGRNGRKRRPWKKVTATEIRGYISAVLLIGAQSGGRDISYY